MFDKYIKPPKKELSFDHLSLCILGFLVLNRSEEKEGFTRHSIKNIRGLGPQRTDRVYKALDNLVSRGFVEEIPSPTIPLYRVTENGINWYQEVGSKFLREFAGFEIITK